MTITEDSTQVIVVEIDAPQTPVRVITPGGLPGETGDAGTDGWSPLFANVADGARRVLQVYDWAGGTGDKPATGEYVGATGLVTDIADGIDVRGAQGVQGIQGPAGADGGVIIGGDTAIIVGDGPPNDADGADGQIYFDEINQNLYQKKDGTWGDPIANLKGSKGDKGDKGDPGDPGDPGPAGANGTAGATGAAGDNGWTPVFAIATDGLRRVQRVVDWTGGGGTKPGTGKYVGLTGFVDIIADGIDIRGETGADGDPGETGAKGDTGDQGIPGPTLSPQGDWNSATTYAKFDDVQVAGVGSFYSLVDANLNHAPASSPTQWRQYSTDGAPGVDGNDGAAATVAVGTVTTVAAGSDATVVNAGTSSAAVLNFEIPQGDQGIQGIQGVKGDPGDTGPDGNTAMTLTSKSAAYTLVLADANQGILHPAADTTARTFTIPANASVAYAVGTMLTFINQHGAGTVTIAITTDIMRLAGDGSTGSRTLAADGVAVAQKITSTEWIISGVGLT